MVTELLKPKQVDIILNLPFGKSKKLAKQGKIPCVTLPDGSMRFNKEVIRQLIHPDEVVEDVYLDLESLAAKLELSEEYLLNLAKHGAIPFHVEGKDKLVFRLISVVDMLTRHNPQDVDMTKTFALYSTIMGYNHNEIKTKKQK